MKTEQAYLEKIGRLIQESRQNRNLTQAELADKIGSSQSAINRIESGKQNITLEMLARISEELSSEIISVNAQKKTNFRVHGGRELHGEIEIKTSKNAAVGLLCASLLNKGKTVLRRVARIEEVNRIIEVLNSIGVKTRWMNAQNDLEIIPPAELDFANIDIEAAKKTRSILMFLGPLLHQYESFQIPFSGGCNLGTRTVEPHLSGLKHFGASVTAQTDFYEVKNSPKKVTKPILLTERGDTTTENVIMAAALSGQTVTLRNASPNYMVQDLCFFLEELGVKIEGIGTTILTIHGVKQIEKDVEYFVSEDPIEALTFIAVALVTNSELKIKRIPAEFTELEMAILESMGAQFEFSPEYTSRNGRTRLVDVVVKKSTLVAPKDKLHSLPFPGVNMDNLPFLGLIATVAEGRTLVHDWSYENRAIYFTELSKLNAKVELVDPHRVYITGKTHWRPADVVAPPALRPSVVVLIAMLAAKGTSVLRDVYNINRGYEDFAERLNSIGADIETITI